MQNLTLEQWQYPIGRFTAQAQYNKETIAKGIAQIKKLPTALREAVAGWNDAQLNTPYREGGWTVRQLIHHLADSHSNSHIRFRLALTEENPTIKPYEEALWATLPDAKEAPVEWSLQILEGLHLRWGVLLDSLSADDLQRGFFHPQAKKTILLAEAIMLYAWHSEHHLTHITRLKTFKNW
ncbi:MAG: putative metal-dependent hydrolase [Cytophagales bacterium]|nr:MAG: putative metal-dependent hydrolase [Cytophagales bacterium]